MPTTLLWSDDASRPVPRRQDHPAVIHFPAGFVIFHKIHPTALRANGLRGFDVNVGMAMGTFQVGRRRHKLMIFEGLQFGAFPAGGGVQQVK
jgi:hypothetical protein